MDPATIVIADTHAGFLRALRTAMSADPRIKVVGEATDLRAARAAVVRHHADGLVVDTGVLEAEGDVLGPLPADTTVIVVGMDDTPGLAERARRHGASGYVVKDQARLLADALLAGRDARPDQ